MVYHKTLLSGAALAAAVVSSPALAQYERDGRACVDGLCLGDGIEALEGVQ